MKASRIINIIAALVMAVALLPFVPKLATEVRADDPVYEDINYVDADGNTQTANCRILTSSDEAIGSEQGQTEAWWAVTEDVTINSNDLLVGGKVNLILCDNATLHVKVVAIDDPTTFNIWCQENGTGKIVTNEPQGVLNEPQGVLVSGSLVLNGGNITHNDPGGGCCVYIHDSGTFIMNGGTVTGVEDGYGVFIPRSGTFIMNGGTVIGDGRAILGPVINNSPGTGWDNIEGTGDGTPIEVSTTARELSYLRVQIIRANYEIKASADPQAGGSVTGAGKYKAGETVTLTAAPSSEHYSFVNWTENGEVVKDVDGNAVGADYTFIASSDREFVANFLPDKHTVTFVNDDGTELQSGEVTHGETPEYTGKTPTKEADAQYTYAFNNWFPEITAAVEEATYKAEYTATVNKYDLTFDLNGGTLNGQTGKITMTYEYGAKIKLPDAPTKEGYKFLYWKGSQYEAGAEYTVDGPHDFTAVWEKVETSPKTGDNNQIIIWHALLGGAIIAGISILIVALKKKQQ